ncbi:HAD-like domain-containing protein [Catenaria anguillulae PL171]|uniref:protein-serine/threonine phosphatase n=1 Tax=Catenaria anguillulae PL171 TaxID=765915 RepID=A0A1Y2HZ36_9FUNG|nr:HAD-like domain-containing protein [Catenaria anguillulae PL171]
MNHSESHTDPAHSVAEQLDHLPSAREPHARSLPDIAPSLDDTLVPVGESEPELVMDVDVAPDDSEDDGDGDTSDPGQGSSPKPKPESDLVLVATWNAKKITLCLPRTATIEHLKLHLEQETLVPAHRQKLVGLVKGRLPADHIVLGTLDLPPPKGTLPGPSFLMMGTADANLFKDPSKLSTLPHVLNDLDDGTVDDFEPTAGSAALAIRKSAKIQQKLMLYVEKTTISVINPPRPGKHLLVLDLDYTIFDCKAFSQNQMDLLRPGTHEFLSAVYQHYDIVIWSQTHWAALEAKVTDMGLISHPSYQLSFVLNKSSMFTIVSKLKDRSLQHQVKALEIIWRKFPDRWSHRNTVHVDDLGRNFALNPGNGIKVSQWRLTDESKQQDREMGLLTKYLVHLRAVPDVSAVDHMKWRSIAKRLP